MSTSFCLGTRDIDCFPSVLPYLDYLSTNSLEFKVSDRTLDLLGPAYNNIARIHSTHSIIGPSEPRYAQTLRHSATEAERVVRVGKKSSPLFLHRRSYMIVMIVIMFTSLL